jgi:hypothetical protein
LKEKTTITKKLLSQQNGQSLVTQQTRYDSEATLYFKERAQCMTFIKSMIPEPQQNRFINTLIANKIDLFILENMEKSVYMPALTHFV